MSYSEINSRNLEKRWWAQKAPLRFHLAARCLLWGGSLFLIFLGVILPVTCVLLAVWLSISPDYLGNKISYLAELTLILLALVLTIPIWRSLSKIRPPEIKGIRLSKNEFPELHLLVEELTTQLHTPKTDSILLTPECSISIISPPRIFGLGRGKHILRIGLPFFLAFSKQDLRALLAHEIAHLSGSLNRVSRLIQFRLITWYQIKDALAETSLLTCFFSLVFNRFFIRPAEGLLYSSQWAAELESDQLAAKTVGLEEFSSAYVKAEILTLLTEKVFWSQIMKGCETEPYPPANVYQQFLNWSINLEQKDYATAFEWVLARQEVAALDHPPAAARLKELKLANFQLLQRESSAIDHMLLGEKKQELISLLSRAWYEEKSVLWRDQFRIRQQRIGNTAYWEEIHLQRELQEAELLDYILGKTAIVTIQERKRLWAEFHARFPDHSLGQFELAKTLETVEPKSAFDKHINLAINNPHYRNKSLWAAFSLLDFPPNSPERTSFLEHSMELMGELHSAQREVEHLSPKDVFSLFESLQELPIISLTQALQQFHAKFPKTGRCWLVKKCSRSLPKFSRTVVALEVPLLRGFEVEQQQAFLALLEPYNVEFVLFLSSPLQKFQWRNITRLQHLEWPEKSHSSAAISEKG